MKKYSARVQKIIDRAKGFSTELIKVSKTEKGITLTFKKTIDGNSQIIKYWTVFEGEGTVMMAEKYLDDKKAQDWLNGLEERKTINSAKAFTRKFE